jgi:uncharacterized membrane protein
MDDFSPEEMREFNENLNSMNASLGTLSGNLDILSRTLNDTSNSLNKSAEELEKTAERTSIAETKKGEKTAQANDDIEATAKKMAGALRIATGAVVSFSGALVSGVEGFDKYSQAVSGFGDSAKQTGDALGGFGKVIGNAVNIITEFTVITMKQADAQNQFAKEMNRMGAIVDTTTQELAEQARAAGASAGDLAEMSVMITQSSQALASFGAGTSEGLSNLMEVFALSDEQERTMRRYGYTLREAQEQQLYYIELQRTSGINMQAREMTEQDVRIKSLQYAKTLNTLSELTGIQAGQLKEEQAAVQADLRNKIRNMRDQNDIERLKKQLDGNITAEKRASIEAEIKAREQEVQVRLDAGNQFAGLLGKDMAAKVMNVIGTGAFDENTKELANLGLNAAELKDRFAGLTAGSDEYRQAVAETTGELVGGVRRNVDRFGKSMELAANASEIGAAVGINDTTTDRSMKFMSEEDAVNRVLESFDEVAESTEKGKDAQKDLAAELQVFETNVRTSADEFLNAINPFTGALGLGTLALGGFTLALGVATTSLYGMAGSGAGSGILDMFTGGKGGKVGRGLGAAKNFLTKGATRFAAPLAAGMSIYSGFSEASEGRDEADAQLNEVLLAEDSSKAEIQRAKEQHEIDTKQANRGGAGTAIGGTGGAIAGAAAGAAIGSFIPIIGTAIGGIIGGALGAYGGAKGGSAIAENYLSPEDLKMYEASDAEYALMTDEEKDKYNEIRDAIEEQTRLQEEEAERLEKAYNDNYEEIKKIGLYDKDLLGNSEVNFEMLAQMRDDGSLSQEMLEAMLYDNDLSEADTALVQKQLDLMKANAEKDEEKDKKEKEVAEVKEPDENSGRTLDMSPENLAKIFEADLKATAKRDAEEQAEKERVAVVKAKEEAVKEQITPEVVANALKETGTGAPEGLVDTEQLLATTKVVEDMVAVADTTAKTLVTSDLEKKLDGDQGSKKHEDFMARKEERLAKKLEEGDFKNDTQKEALERQLAKTRDIQQERGYASNMLPDGVTVDEVSGKFRASAAQVGEDGTQVMAQLFDNLDEAKEYTQSDPYATEAGQALRSELDANFAEMMGEVDASGAALGAPVVDIAPEPTEDDDFHYQKDTGDGQLAQTDTGSGEMTEYEKRSLALQEQQIAKLARIDNATTETADGTQKIAINSSV